MGSSITSGPPVVSRGGPAKLLLIMGGDNALGFNTRYRKIQGPRLPKGQVYIYDKMQRTLRFSPTISGSFREITPGYGGGVDQPRPPWLDKSNDYFGPELGLAHHWAEERREKLHIIKLAVAGSFAGKTSFWNWSPKSEEKHSLMRVLTQGYLGYAAAEMTGLYGQEGWEWMGAVALLGQADSGLPELAENHQAHVLDVIDAATSRLFPPGLPWLMVRPRLPTADSERRRAMHAIRDAQLDLGKAPGMFVQDLPTRSYQPENSELLGPQGQWDLGLQIGRWATGPTRG